MQFLFDSTYSEQLLMPLGVSSPAFLLREPNYSARPRLNVFYVSTVSWIEITKELGRDSLFYTTVYCPKM